MYRMLIFPLLACSVIHSTTAAQLLHCDGVWTNKICDPAAEITGGIKETEMTEAEKMRRAKYSLADKLVTFVTHSAYDGDSNPAYGARKYCRQDEVTFDQCKDNVSKLLEYYAPLVESANQQYRARRLAEERAALEEQRHQEQVAATESVQLEVEALRRQVELNQHFNQQW